MEHFDKDKMVLERVCINFSPRALAKAEYDIILKENFDFGEALESVYPLLEIVFSYLGQSDLKNAALVKESWKTIIDKMLKKRNEFSCMIVQNTDAIPIKTSHNFGYANSQFGIVLYSYNHLHQNCLCYHNTLEKETHMKDFEFLKNCVEPICSEYCVLSCVGFDLFFPNVTSNVSPYAVYNLFAIIFIPEIPNVRMAYFFYKSRKQIRHLNISNNETLKCLLLLSSNSTKLVSHALKDLIPLEACHQVAVGGGIISDVEFNLMNNKSSDNEENEVSCIAFIENTNGESTFNAYSIVIPGADLTIEEFESNLVKFKKHVILRKNSIAFIFCCSAKLNSYLESKVLQKVFPDTVVLGIHAHGELGWNCFHPEEKEIEVRPKRGKRGYPKSKHCFSTVIVFISWGYIINQC